jgi:hypothetical protein
VRGVFHLGRRVGRIDEQETVTATGRIVRTRTLLQIQRGPRRSVLEREQEATLGPQGDLLSAELRAEELRSRVRVLPGALLLEVEGSGHRFAHRLSRSRPVHLLTTLPRWLAQMGLRPGHTQEIALFDLEHGRLREATVRWGGRQSWHGIPAFEATVVVSPGVSWPILFGETGEILESREPVPGIETRLLRPGDLDRPLYAVDLGAWGRVMTSGQIQDPTRVRRLRLRLRGLPPGLGVPANQEIVASSWPRGVKRPAGPATLPELFPAPFIESDALEIQELARLLMAPEADLEEAARAVLTWIQENIRQGDTVGPPSALATLRTRRGNCNEISVLAVALLRAAGFPARLAFGISFIEGTFRYHAWVEARAEGRWVAFDPTFGQIPADPTHLLLAAGGMEAQATMLDAVGRLTVEIAQVEEETRR